MQEKNYQLLKDLPNAKKGEIFSLLKTEYDWGGEWELIGIDGGVHFSEAEINDYDILNPDKGWFEEINVKEGIELIEPVKGFPRKISISCTSPEETKKILKRLWAWQSLNERGFRFLDYHLSSEIPVGDDGVEKEERRLNIWAQVPSSEMARICKKELDLLFSGGEDE